MTVRARQARPARAVVALVLLLLAAGCSSGSSAGRPRTTASPSASPKPSAAMSPVRSWLAHPPLYVAHRGGDADWPEGTPFAYRQAVAWNPHLAMEVPVRRTADGVWVVSEEPTTASVFGRDLVIKKTPWATLSTLRSLNGELPMSRLREDVLDVVPRNRVLFVDDKADILPGDLLDLLDQYGGPARTVIKAYWASRRMPAEAHRRGYLVWGYYYSNGLADFAATQSRFDLLGLEWSAPESAFARFRATGKPVIAHVVADAAQARRALGLGASGLMVSGIQQVVPRGG